MFSFCSLPAQPKKKFYQWRVENPHYNPDFRGLGQKRSQSRYAPFIVQMWILFCLVFETCLKNVGISKVCHHVHHEHVKKHPIPLRSRARSPGIFLNHMASCGFSYWSQYDQETSFLLLENLNISCSKKSLPQMIQNPWGKLPSGLLSYRISRQIQWFLLSLSLPLISKQKIQKKSCSYSRAQCHF